MIKRPRWLPTPALVIASLALIVALGGTAVAITNVGSNDIGAKQLKKVTVRTVQSPQFPAPQAENNGNPDWRRVTVTCNKSEIAISGGLDWSVGDEADLTALYTSEVEPIISKGEAIGYNIAGASDENPDTGPIFFTAYAECLKK